MKPLEAWAIVDTQEEDSPFPQTRWTYYGEDGKKIGLLAIYDKKPTIPKEWRHSKKVIRVLIDAQ